MENSISNNVDATWRVGPEMDTCLGDYLLYRRHLFAYEEALRSARSGGAVVDIACGLGYALESLSHGRSHVFALDLAWLPLRALNAPGQVQKIQADAARLPFANGSLNVVLAFQLIEHVPIPVAREILSEIQRVLAAGGRGFVTTPNARWRLLPGQRPWNPYHVIEYSARAITRLCDAAGLERYSIRGVIGRGGAQERELARVRQDPLKIYGGQPGSFLRRAYDRVFGTADLAPSEPVAPEDRSKEWFELTDDVARGLDFWIELQG